MFIGVDGCRGGWLLAVLDSEGTLRFELTEALEEVVAQARAGSATVVVDMPIGLPAGGRRACDIQARQLLGPRRASSVFPAPGRPALAALDDYARASRLNATALGTKLTRQTFAILPKIAALDALITPDVQRAMREGHPEVIFRVLARQPLGAGKRDPHGLAERVELLRGVGLEVDVERERARLGRARVAPDDVVDAAACAVAARRVAQGEALVFPLASSEVDERGLRMEIVA
ncbi:MAG: DUF429 domain-containing protein [Vicinamibacterales bacterium]